MKRISSVFLVLSLLLQQIACHALPWAAAAHDFDIQNGILLKYTGTGGAVTIPSDVKVIGEGAFQGNRTITGLAMSGNVAEIRAEAFSGCTELKAVKMSLNVIMIGEGAFENCTSLNDLELPQKVAQIGKNAFYLCSGFAGKNIVIPATVSRIEDETFMGTHMKSVMIPNSVTWIGEGAFRGGILKKVNIPNSVQYIGSEAFRDCSFSQVVIPDSVASVAGGCFADCNNLTSVVLPQNLKKIEKYTFIGCVNLSYVQIPSSVTSIEEGAFWGCYSLRDVELPAGVKSIGEGAFGSCENLNNIFIPKSATDLGEGLFENCKTVTIYGEAGSRAQAYAKEKGIKFVVGRIPSPTAVPTKSKVYLNDKIMSFEAYNIDGNNYFKLRDLSQALSGTEKQFDVKYIPDTKEIQMITGKPYTPAAQSIGAPYVKQEAKPTVSQMYVDGEKLSYRVYNIGGNNYFRLRDIAAAIDFGVYYKSEDKSIHIDTSMEYSFEY